MTEIITQTRKHELVKTTLISSRDTQKDQHRSQLIIWTPRFIVLFTLTLAGGLSAASLLTRGWQNGYYDGNWVLLIQSASIFAVWIALALRSRTVWARMGAIFGCLWTLFTAMSFVASLRSVMPELPIIAYINAAAACALFGSYVSLSVNHIPVGRWDSWFFRIASASGGMIAIAAFFLMPVETRLAGFASTVAALALYLCSATWWLRPSCWKTQPGPTFFFGMSPVILLLLSIPRAFSGATNFLFLQISLLCLLLGALRTLQGERQRARG
jgi:hypothetical protein